MTSKRKEDLIDSALSLADQLFRQLFHTVPKDLLTLDVTMPQLKILLVLYIVGPTRMSAIASELDVTLPTATSLVDRLVDKGYVSRETQPGDRRVVICRLSETGQKVIGQIWESSRISSHEILDEMDVTRLTMFVEILDDMLKSAKAKNEKVMGKR
jgi:DNA-binding MarR family transcriptional regulator